MNTLINSWRNSLTLLRPHNIKLLIESGYNSVRTSVWPLLRVFGWTFLFGMLLAIIFIGAVVIKTGHLEFSAASIEPFQPYMNYFAQIINVLAIWGYLAAIRPTQEKYRKGYYFHMLWEYKLAVLLSMLSIALMFPFTVNTFLHTWLITSLFGLSLILMLGILDKAPTMEGLLAGLRKGLDVILAAAPIWLLWFALLFGAQLARKMMLPPMTGNASQATLMLMVKDVIFDTLLWFVRASLYVIGVQMYYRLKK